MFFNDLKKNEKIFLAAAEELPEESKIDIIIEKDDDGKRPLYDDEDEDEEEEKDGQYTVTVHLTAVKQDEKGLKDLAAAIEVQLLELASITKVDSVDIEEE